MPLHYVKKYCRRSVTIRIAWRISPASSVCPDQFRNSIFAPQVNPDLAVTEYRKMSRFVVIHDYYEAQTFLPMNRDHAPV